MSTYVHAVFFTCKPNTPASRIDLLAAAGQAMLSRIPSVKALFSGRRDETMVRDVNDQEFHVGLAVQFESLDGYRLYADHPFHLEFIQKHKDHWASVRVCDFIAP